MADAVNVEYLYPPDMESGQWDEKSGNRRVVVRLSCVSDGTGEINVTKVDLDDLKTTSRKVPTRTAIEKVEYIVTGMTVLLQWDRAPAAEICRIDGNGTSVSGELNWCRIGGKVDPGVDDRTGDIMITTSNADNGDTYELTVYIRLKE